jgi:hypothetical protein
MNGSDIASSVSEAERRRCDAMLSNDVAALDGLLDARLNFSHSSGEVDDKAGYLAKIAVGRITYVSIEWRDQRVIPLAEAAAVLVGRMTSIVRVEGWARPLDNRVTSVWNRAGNDWRMVAFQSTPLRP